MNFARYSVEFKTLDDKATMTGDAECSCAFLFERTWWNYADFHSSPPAVPVVLEWGTIAAEYELLSTREAAAITTPPPAVGTHWPGMLLEYLVFCKEGCRGNYNCPQGGRGEIRMSIFILYLSLRLVIQSQVERHASSKPTKIPRT